MPILQSLSAKPLARPHVRALILTPTRELAAQVEQSVKTYGRHLRMKSTTVFGGVNINPQVQTLRRGVDILVATPGRLLDHIRSRTVDLSKVEILVLDEADRMLDMGFIHDIRRILDVLPKRRQNLFFSATFPREIRQFADSFLTNPAEIAIARQSTTADLITQVVHPVDKGSKRALISSLIGKGNWQQVLIFTRTKHGANRLAGQLEKDGITAAAIHGNKSQGARTRALADFKRGAVRALVATDIAARGLDIKELPHVVNYELPNVPEDYVHRIGRTGRAGSNGVAMSLVCHEEKPLLADIERTTRNRIESVIIEGFEPGTHHRDETDTRDAARGARPGSNSRNPKRSGARSSTPGRAKQAKQPNSHSTRAAQPGSADQPAKPAKRRRGGRKHKRTATAENQANAAASTSQSRPFQSALRAVASIFGGAGQRDN